MSMSTHVVGIKPIDETYEKMLAVWKACDVARVPIPQEVNNFFGDDAELATGPPNEIRVCLENHRCVSRCGGEMEFGFDVDLSKVPDDIKIIRFYNSY